MPIRIEPWPAGTPCWADLTTPDVGAARDFYTQVLGWEFADADAEYGGYAMAHRDGSPAAGIGPLPDRAPAAWTLYFASDDAAATETAIATHGGTVLLPAEDVGPLGRTVLATDPAGAVFGVWQAGTHTGFGPQHRPGENSWDDLRSTDPDRARDFYGTVFGLTFEPLEMAGPDYTTFHLGAGLPPLGGMGGMMGQPELPSHWLVYFAVESAHDASTQAASAGGAVITPPFQTPYGTMAALTDPAGAGFWVVQLPPS